MSCWNKSGSVKNLVQFCRGYQFINKKITSMFEFTVKRTHNMYNKIINKLGERIITDIQQYYKHDWYIHIHCVNTNTMKNIKTS